MFITKWQFFSTNVSFFLCFFISSHFFVNHMICVHFMLWVFRFFTQNKNKLFGNKRSNGLKILNWLTVARMHKESAAEIPNLPTICFRSSWGRLKGPFWCPMYSYTVINTMLYWTNKSICHTGKAPHLFKKERNLGFGDR